MTRFKHTTAAYLSATLLVVAGCQLSAFEQGTYFIYQLVEDSDAQVIDKRLVVDSQLFIETRKTRAEVAPETKEHSEFEMNFNSFGTTANSGFDSSPTKSNEAQTTNESSVFDLGTQDDVSLFGN